MGAFNTVVGKAICPKCKRHVRVIGQFKFGNVRQFSYRIGDMLGWGGNEIGRSGFQHVVVDAIAETNCPSCGFSGEWDLYLHVQCDRLVRLETATGDHDFVREGKNYCVLSE
jgi:hypothetical protein